MKFTVFRAGILPCLTFALAMGMAMGSGLSPAIGQEIPDDLLEDEHVREEFGVNRFTTPSIRKIFEDLRTLRPLPYEELRRGIPSDTPSDRVELAISLGFLLAEGFFSVEAEQFLDLEPIGRALLKHGEVLGAGTRMSSHTKSLIEHGALSDWTGLKEELARTQKDVEKEMVLIRDVDAANLISLGGWLRAFEIGCSASLDPYDPEKARILQRPDIVEYFALNIQTLEERAQGNPIVSRVAAELPALQEKVTLPDQSVLTEEQVIELRSTVRQLVDLAYGHPLLAQADVPGQAKKGASSGTAATRSRATSATGDDANAKEDGKSEGKQMPTKSIEPSGSVTPPVEAPDPDGPDSSGSRPEPKPATGGVTTGEVEDDGE